MIGIPEIFGSGKQLQNINLSATLNPITEAEELDENLLPTVKDKNNNKNDLDKKIANLKDKEIVINHIKIEGLTVYDKKDILKFYQHLLGQKKTLRQFIKATEFVIEKYWNDGYVLAEADFKIKDFADGDDHIILTLHEGRIVDTEIIGGDKGVHSLIGNNLELLTRNQPFNMDTMEVFNLLLRDMPSVILTGKIIPIKDKKGVGKVQFTVSKEKLVKFISLDNYGSRYIGPIRGQVGLWTHSLINDADSTLLNAWFTPGTNELYYGSLMHILPLNMDGNNLIFRADYGETRPGYTLQPLSIKGTNSLYSAAYQHIIPTTFGHNFIIKGGAETLSAYYKNPTATIYNDRTHSLFLNLTDQFKDFWRAGYVAQLSLYKGIRGFGSSENVQEKSHPLGRADYTKLMAELIRIQKLTSEFSLFTRVKGQYSFQPLLQLQQFSFGSYPYGSAYEPAELAGDQGVAARGEIRYDLPITGDYKFKSGQTYIFYDSGKIWNKDISSGPNAKSAASAGIGLRLHAFEFLEADFELAQALTHGLNSRFLSSDKKPLRFLFKVSAKF